MRWREKCILGLEPWCLLLFWFCFFVRATHPDDRVEPQLAGKQRRRGNGFDDNIVSRPLRDVTKQESSPPLEDIRAPLPLCAVLRLGPADNDLMRIRLHIHTGTVLKKEERA